MLCATILSSKLLKGNWIFIKLYTKACDVRARVVEIGLWLKMFYSLNFAVCWKQWHFCGIVLEYFVSTLNTMTAIHSCVCHPFNKVLCEHSTLLWTKSLNVDFNVVWIHSANMIYRCIRTCHVNLIEMKKKRKKMR